MYVMTNERAEIGQCIAIPEATRARLAVNEKRNHFLTVF